MPNVMFMVVDEGFPSGNLQQVTDEQFAQLQSYHWELDCGETEDWEVWENIVFDQQTEIELPATVTQLVQFLSIKEQHVLSF